MRIQEQSVTVPIQINGKQLRPLSTAPAARWCLSAKIVGLAVICVASALFGGFVLPSGRGSASDQIAVPEADGVATPVPVVAKVDIPPTPIPIVKPADAPP